jgi:hypothetical protein
LVAIDPYNHRAIDALQRAQALSGARSAVAFARLLAERAGGSPSASAYRRWITGEAVVPAWALGVAAEVVGVAVAELVSGEPADAAPDQWRRQIEDAIGRLEGEMIEVREKLGMPWSDRQEESTSEHDLPERARSTG